MNRLFLRAVVGSFLPRNPGRAGVSSSMALSSGAFCPFCPPTRFTCRRSQSPPILPSRAYTILHAPRRSPRMGMEPIGDAERAECAAFTPSPDIPYLLEPDEHVVFLSMPLGIKLKASRTGVVYVSAVVDGGSAAADGGVAVGDVVTCCSVPFGDGLASVPRQNGVDFVAEQMQWRGEDEEHFILCLKRSDAEMKRFLALDDEGVLMSRTTTDIRPLMQKVMNKDEFVMLTPELRAEFERREDELAQEQAKAMGLNGQSAGVSVSDDGIELVGTDGGKDDRLFHVSDALERETERKLEERMQTYRENQE